MTLRVPGRGPIACRTGLLLLAVLSTGCSLGSDTSDPADDLVAEVADTAASNATVGVSSPGPGDSAEAPDEGIDVAAEGSLADSSSAPSLEAAIPPRVAADESTVEQRLDRLIERQEATNRRLDELAAQRPDSSTGDVAPEAVLGEAGDRVRSFGVGIAWSVVVLILFNVTIHSLVWVLDRLSERNASRRLFYKRLVPIVRIVLWVFAAYLIIRVIFRVDAQGILAATAAIGVAVGFAAQDLLKNLFGGLILVFDQPFQVGDKISIGGTYGEVVSIGLRSTRIVTPDDNLVSVPNSQVVDQQVANANAGELNCQVVTDLYLPGWADEAEAKRIAFQAAASSKYVFQKKPIVTLVSDVFKETFLTRVRVKAYVLDPRLEFQFQSDVTERARAGFREAGLLRPEHMRAGLVDQSAAPLTLPTEEIDDLA